MRASSSVSGSEGPLTKGSDLIQEWLIVGGFTGVHVNPAGEAVRVVLDPHMVCQVEDVASLQPDCAAAQCKGIRPLAAAAAPGLQQPAGVVVARKSAEHGYNLQNLL